MNSVFDFFTDVTVVAAVTTASHFGIAIDGAQPRTPASAEARTVRRTAVGSTAARPPAQTMRAPAR